MDDLLHILQYLFQTQDKGLILEKCEPHAELHLTCYVDASWLSYPNSRSQTGLCLFCGNTGAFYAKSLKQSTVMTSTSAAEMRALFQLMQEVIFIIGPCKELESPLHLPVLILEDNESTNFLATQEAMRLKRAKHFLMLIHYD